MNAKRKKEKNAAKAADPTEATGPGTERAQSDVSADTPPQDQGKAASASPDPDIAPPVCEEDSKEIPSAPPVDDRFLRLQADFENFKRRTLRERNELYRRANEDIVQELLPVMDHMTLALNSAAEHNAAQAFIDGFKLVSEQLQSALAKFGVTRIEAAGCEFDPNVHEAVSHLPSPDVVENHVCHVLRGGYMMGDRLLRAAQVVVSSGPPPAPAADAGERQDEVATG